MNSQFGFAYDRLCTRRIGLRALDQKTVACKPATSVTSCFATTSRSALNRFDRHPYLDQLLATLVVVFLSLMVREAGAANPPLWGDLKPGPYDVGFKVLSLVDQTRFYGNRPSRPIQVSLWFPVPHDSSRSRPNLQFSDYVALYMTTGSIENRGTAAARSEAIQRYRQEWFPKEPESSVDRVLQTPTFALVNAQAARGPFPLIVYAPGYGAIPLTHTPTAEFLASHGYVVALSPSQGDSPSGMTFDVAGQEEQIRDIEFTIAALRNRPSIDSSKIALIGFSFGGGSAVVAAMRIPGIKAVVSLDGTVAFDHTVDILRQATGYDPAKFRSPLLVLKEEGDPEEDLGIVRSLAMRDRVIIRFNGAQHHDFIASPIISSVVTGNVEPSGTRAYPLVASTVLRFVTEHMSTAPVPLHSWVTLASGNTVQPGDPSSEVLLPRVEAQSTQDLVSESIADDNIDRLIAAQGVLGAQAAGMPLLTPGTLHMLGLKFLDQGQNVKAIQLYEFFVQLYPHDFFALNVLGDIYRELKETEKAVQCYRRSLTVMPGNGGALEGLRMIDAAATNDK